MILLETGCKVVVLEPSNFGFERIVLHDCEICGCREHFPQYPDSDGTYTIAMFSDGKRVYCEDCMRSLIQMKYNI